MPGFVRFGREVTGDLDAALRREWLVTNGLGSYASGTIAGVPTRRYHGLLVAALEPPVARTVLVAGSLETLIDGEWRVPISCLEHADGTVDPRGDREVESFELDGTLPVWRFAIGALLVERRVWMPAGEKAAWLTFRLLRGDRRIGVEVRPLLVNRPFHDLASQGTPGTRLVPGPGAAATHRLETRWTPDGPAVWVEPTAGEVTADWTWIRGLHHRDETVRGLDDTSDAWIPGTVTLPLEPGRLVGVRFGLAPAAHPLDPERELWAEQARQDGLVARAGAAASPPAFRQLVLAADQFLVDRPPSGRTVIAGYHWFNDWGRDTMIALPGLTLVTGRPEEAAAILRAFAPFVRDGLLPNSFPDRAGVEPAYNTVDASLWYLVAIQRTVEATGDAQLLTDLVPVAREIVERHIAGTRYGIGMDPTDALLRAGGPGSQLTWMDAKIGDTAFTSRAGKPVEIQALWYNALRLLAGWLAATDPAASARLDALADRARASFRARFLAPGRDHAADVIDGPDGDDLAIRPNQVFAVALPHPLLDGAAAAGVVASAGRGLVTSLGLRSLDPGDPAYRRDYAGDRWRRDSGYHQGPVWSWLIGAWVEAHLRVHGDPEAARTFLAPFLDHLRDAGLGSVSEILDGDPPHTPRGAAFQAWGVAEVLRAWRLLDDAERVTRQAPADR